MGYRLPVPDEDGDSRWGPGTFVFAILLTLVIFFNSLTPAASTSYILGALAGAVVGGFGFTYLFILVSRGLMWLSPFTGEEDDEN